MHYPRALTLMARVKEEWYGDVVGARVVLEKALEWSAGNYKAMAALGTLLACTTCYDAGSSDGSADFDGGVGGNAGDVGATGACFDTCAGQKSQKSRALLY